MDNKDILKSKNLPDNDNNNDNVDIKQYDSWVQKDFIKEIKKLRKENAKWRTNFRDSKDAHSDLDSKFLKLQTALDSVNRQHEKLKSEVDSGTFVKLDSVKLMQESLTENANGFESKYNDAVKGLNKERLLRTAYNIVHDKSYKFKNKQERIGFETSVLQTNEDGSFKSQEEIGNEIEGFLQENFEPSNLPPSGSRPVDASPRKEIASLLAKGTNMTKEDVNRVKELEKGIETS